MAGEPATRPIGRPAASRWRSDLWIVLALALVCYGLSRALNLSEWLVARSVPYERWQLDELPLTGMVFAFGVAWYAWRRRYETESALRAREQAEARASELLAHNRELAQQLLAVQESERLALARELHDEFGQRCSAILIETACLRRCAADDRAALLGAAARADIAAQSLYQLVGGLLRRLRPANLDALGLVAALQELCEAWEERSGVACVLHREDMAEALPERVNIAVYRVAQEALTNVMRHAHANQVRLVLAREPTGGVCLSVVDDGCGMDPARATRGLGLLGASERAAALGGELRVESTPGAGVRLSLHIPLPAAVAPVAEQARVSARAVA
ncbi:sensor histidine kinase [Ideonella sp.]|uniref:sensor histidine kinase n=1 Tax=Ideonella sp. TaxID=1929293 RepID=UPI00351BB001